MYMNIYSTCTVYIYTIRNTYIYIYSIIHSSILYILKYNINNDEYLCIVYSIICIEINIIILCDDLFYLKNYLFVFCIYYYYNYFNYITHVSIAT